MPLLREASIAARLRAQTVEAARAKGVPPALERGVTAAGKPEPAGSKLAYAYCCAVRDHGRVSKQAIAAGEKVLKNMGYRTWVQHGQWSTLGMWMKCVRGQAAGASPLEVITSAYDFVPASVRERAASFLPLR